MLTTMRRCRDAMNAFASAFSAQADPAPPAPSRTRALLVITATALVVTLACCLGSHFGSLPNAGRYASFWPATALALVAVVWKGPWALPGVLLGRLLFDALPATLAGPQALGIGPTSLIMAALTVLQAALGAWSLLRWCRGSMSLLEPGPTLRLLALAAASSLPSGSFRLFVHETPMPQQHLGWLWMTAVAGDLLGVLLLTPVLLLSLQQDASVKVRRIWLWLLLAAGYLMSWCISTWVMNLEEHRIHTQWTEMQARLQQKLQTGLRQHERVLESLAKMMSRTPDIDGATFADSASPLLGLATPSFALFWSPLVPQARHSTVVTEPQRPASQAPMSPDQSVSPLEPERQPAFLAPVLAVEPAGENRHMLGLDLFADPAQKAAIETALHAQQMAATQRLRLNSQAGPTYGVMALLPVGEVAQKATADRLPSGTRGFAGAVLPLERMVAQLALEPHAGAPLANAQADLDSLPNISPRSVVYRLLDLDAPLTEQLVWHHGAQDGSAAMPRSVSRLGWLQTGALPEPEHVELVFAGRHFRLDTGPRPDFWASNISLWPYTVFTACLWMTVACNVILLLFTGYRQSLAQEVEERTVDLLQIQYSLTEAMRFAQANSAQLDFLLQRTPVGFLGFDENGRYLLGNQALVDMLGLSSLAEIPNINVFISELLRRLPGIGLHRLAALADSRHGQTAPELQLNRVRLVTPKGQTRHVTLQAMKYPLGPVRHLFTLVDLSSDVALESSKAEFLSLVAHEIRTPLTSVRGYAELLHARPDLQEGQRMELAEAISLRAQQIHALLGKMLNLSELEVGGVDALKTQVHDTRHWLTRVVKTYVPPAGRRPPDLLGSDEVLHARIDARKLERALIELLDNAYSFSGPDDPVQVRLNQAQVEDGPPELRLTISDWGMGMDEAQMKRACDKFYRVDKSGEKPGCGLGLPLAKLIVELHQGRLELSARVPGPGLIAVISLTLAPPP